MDNAKIKEIVITLENLDDIRFDGRYIEAIHIGDIKHWGYSNHDFVTVEDFWLRVKPEGNIGFTKPDADPDDPSTWEYMDEITEHKFEVLNTRGQVTQLNIRYTDADGQQERTEHYFVYSEDWSDDELDNLTFNPCQHTHIDGEGSLFMVISKEHSLADAFPESLPDKTEIRETRLGRAQENKKHADLDG